MQLDILVIEAGHIRRDVIAAQTVEGLTTVIDSYNGRAVPQFALIVEDGGYLVGMAANHPDSAINVYTPQGRAIRGVVLIVSMCEHMHLREMTERDMSLFRVVEIPDGRRMLLAAEPKPGGLVS